MSTQASPSIKVEHAEKRSPEKRSPAKGNRSPRNDRSPRNGTTPRRTGKDPKRRVKFGVPLCDALKDNKLPPALVEMLVYIAQEGVTTTDLFRRPGNNNELKAIINRLQEGKDVHLDNYNFYTLASVIKNFLLKIPGGIFGPETEKKILKVLEKNQRMEQYDYLHSVISRLPVATQQLLALLFGTWFRIVNHSEFNAMSSEAVAKSVAGSLFHTCAEDPRKIEQAVEVLQILIDDFGVANLFGRKNIQYFADMTRTGIRVREKFRYEYRYPAGESSGSDTTLELFALKLQHEAQQRGFNIHKDAITEEEFYGALASRRSTGDAAGLGLRMRASQPPSPQSLQPQHDYTPPQQKLHSVSCSSAPEVNKGYSPTHELSPAKRISTSLSRFDNVKKRQMIRMKKRSNWFLSPSQAQLGSTESAVGTSGGHSSSDDALLSDMTLSDASPLSTRRHHQHHHHQAHINTPRSPRSQDIVNGNHPTLELSPEPSPAASQSSHSPGGSLGVGTKMTSLIPPWDSSTSPSRSPSPQVPSPLAPSPQHRSTTHQIPASSPITQPRMTSSSVTSSSVASSVVAPQSITSQPTTSHVTSSSPLPPPHAPSSSSTTSSSATHASGPPRMTSPIASSHVTSHDISSEHQVRYFMLETFYGSDDPVPTTTHS